jgi:hypothetical protein
MGSVPISRAADDAVTADLSKDEGRVLFHDTAARI